MSLILHIDTASEHASVSLANDGILLGVRENNSQRDHAAFLQPAVDELFSSNGILPGDLKAVSVVSGPGSYTGLRVGMASAKGYCYALNIPLLTVSSLHLLAASAIGSEAFIPGSILCPMIDARRMEVFTATYNPDCSQLSSPVALILDEHSFETELSRGPVLFFGSGAGKWENVCSHPNARFAKISPDPATFARLSYQLYEQQSFTSLAYSEPLYVKEFYSAQKGQA